jgi:hypothetical protein
MMSLRMVCSTVATLACFSILQQIKSGQKYRVFDDAAKNQIMFYPILLYTMSTSLGYAMLYANSEIVHIGSPNNY